MSIHKLVSSFNAGELSPLMDSRVNVEKYDAGCRRLRNFLLHTHGPIFRRPGLEYMGNAASHESKSRILAFNFSTTTKFVIEMAVGRFRFWSNDELVLDDDGVEVNATHPYAEDELFEVQMKQVNDVCYFAHRNHHPLKLIRKADDDWTCEPVPLRYPPLLDEFVEKESVATPTVTEIYETELQEADEVVFTQRTPGTIPTFTINTRAGTLGAPLSWFDVTWTWPGSPGTPTKVLDLQVWRARDSTWQSVPGAITLSATASVPMTHSFQLRANGTTSLIVDRKQGSGAWAQIAILPSFFASTTAIGAVPNQQFRLVYGPYTTNDLTAHYAIATDWEANATNTNLVHVLANTASKEITATWTLPTPTAGRVMYPQILNSSNNWTFFTYALAPTVAYGWSLATLPPDRTYRLRYLQPHNGYIALDEKQTDGSWLLVGYTLMSVATSWTFRVLYFPETVQGLSRTTIAIGGITADSPTVTMASTAGRSAGEGVTGTGIPTGTTILSVDDATTLTLSADATISNSVNLTFNSGAAKVVLADGSVTHTANAERQDGGAGSDRGKGGVTVPKGKWQARVDVDVTTVPTGATVTLQRWTGAAWVNVTAAWTLVSGKSYEYNGTLSGEFTVPTLVRLLYKGGASFRKTAGTGAIETVVYPDSGAITLEVSSTSGPGRTMLAKDHLGDPKDLFKAGHVGSYWQIAHRRELSYSELVGVVGSFVTLNSTEIRVSGRWDLTTYGTWYGTVHLERKSPSNEWEIVRSWRSNGDRNVTATGTEEQDVDMRLRAVSGMVGAAASGAAVPRFILEAADSRTYGLVKIVEFVSTSEVTVDVVRILGATTATTLWAEGAWSDYRGFPAAVGLHEARLWFGGSSHQPQTLWASVSNDFENFRRSTLDDGSLAVTLAAESSNSIRWINSSTALLIGTGGEEWALRSSSEGAAITPTTVQVQRQSGYSSMPLGAQLAHEVTIFVQRDGRRVRQLSYRQDQQGYGAADLTVLAPHVTEGGVVQVAFQQAPTAILWVVTAEGKLAGMTFEKEQNVFGWHIHETDGEIESVCVLHGTPSDEVWCSVMRTIGGETRRYIERMQPLAMAADWSDQSALIYLDSAKYYEPEEPSEVLTGLEHLEGKTVSILANGMIHESQVVTDGEITLTFAPDKAVVGLPYTSEVQPMKQEVPLQDGTAQGRRFKLSRATVRMDNSLGGELNANALDTSLPWARIPNQLVVGEPTPLYTGERDIILESRHEAAVNLTVRQTEPFPLNITGLVLIFDVYDS